MKAHLGRLPTLISLFTTCKPFVGLDDIHQRNALRSWCALNPRPEIIVIGNEEGTAAVCQEYGLKHVPELVYTAFGKPDVRDVFLKAQTVATGDILAYVNADIVLFQDFVSAVQLARVQHDRFLMCGQRLDVDLDETIDDWRVAKILAQWAGIPLPPTGTDYFVFTRGMLADLVPGLGMGHLAWDNYIPWYAVNKDKAVFLNATELVTAMHQNHEVPELGEHPAAIENHRIVRSQGENGVFCGLFLFNAQPLRGTMQGRLFGDKLINLDSRTLRYGGAWWQKLAPAPDGIPVAHDDNLLELVWERIKDQAAPVLIDVGASTGMFALLAAHHLGMTGIAFEPFAEAHAVLTENIWLNGLQDRIKTRAAAVGSQSGVGELFITNDRDKAGLNRLNQQVANHDNTPQAVPVVTLDEVCKDITPTLIKVDVEGGELDVVKGAEQTIKRCKPLMLLECSTDMVPAYGYETDDLRGLLRSWGATVTQADDGNILAYWEEAKPEPKPMNDTVSIVIPSMNRAARLEGCVKRILETTPYRPLEIIAVIDVDTESRDRLLALNNNCVKVLFNETRKGAIACWNQGLAAATGDILAFFNDDCMPDPGWLEAALKAHKEQLNGYGLIGFNDGYQDGNELSVQFLYDRQFCIDVLGGVMAYPVYGFAYNDTEAHARAKLSGHFYWCRESVVQHNHWSRPGVGNGPDALNHENIALQGKDGFIYEERKAHGFPNNFEPVLKAA